MPIQETTDYGLVEQQRIQFERWVRLRPVDADDFTRSRKNPDEYQNPVIRFAWLAWQEQERRHAEGKE